MYGDVIMYSFIFRKLLVGPKWLKVIEALVLAAGIVFILFNYAFPAIAPYMPLNNNSTL